MRSILIIAFITAMFSSCKVFKSNLMLKTPKNYQYDQLADSLSRLDYKIAPNDILSYRVFTNDGFKLIDIAATASNFVAFPTIESKVESDGNVKLPLIGKVELVGLSIVEAEKLLEEKYASFYVKPFVNIKIINKRIIVFPGNAGTAKVLPITNNNTTVMEALAMAGGITDDGKAYKVKLIRNTPGQEPKVYLMDLSRISGIAAANTQVQAYDIIYVEPRYRPIRTFSTEVAPVLTLITTGIILISLFR
ncbi:MAG: polysaccharide biosynthesis/export family protein [Bacteroidia bacterium]